LVNELNEVSMILAEIYNKKEAEREEKQKKKVNEEIE